MTVKKYYLQKWNRKKWVFFFFLLIAKKCGPKITDRGHWHALSSRKNCFFKFNDELFL